MAWVRHGSEAGAHAHILASHSLNPAAMRAHITLYRTIMFGESPLSRVEREAMAVAVSTANACHY